MTSPADVYSRLDQTLLALCAIPSPTGEETAIADVIERRLRQVSGSVVRIGDSVVAGIPGSQGETRARVGLVGHLDTVRTENGPARIEDGRCFGAGASDMKAGLAIMLTLAETTRARQLPCDLSFVFYAREEGAYLDNELGQVLVEDDALRHLDLAVCLEPSDNKLQLGCGGSIHATVTFEGRTGHSARPWEADNAITRGADFLSELGKRASIDSVVDGVVFKTVTTATQARDGGRGRNVVPDRFVINLNHRFAPATSLAQAQDDLTALVGGRARMVFTDLSPAAMPNASHPLVKKLAAAGARAVEAKQAWTDVARFASVGVPAVNFGPGENAQAHQRDESTSLDLLHEGYEILTRWLASLG